MTKCLVLLILSFCLVLQHTKAFLQNVIISEQSTEREMTKDFETGLAKSTTTTAQATTDVVTEEGTDSKQESDSYSTQNFAYRPLKYDIIKNGLTLFTLQVVQYQLNILLSVGHEYTTASLKILNELPNKTPSIEANITHLTTLLSRLEGLDLTKNDFFDFLDKLGLINNLKELYKNFAELQRLVEIDDDVLSELYNTLSLRIEASLKETAEKLTKIFHNFFGKLDEKENLRFAEVIKAYDKFKSHNTDLDKYKDAVFLLLDNPIWD